MIHSLGGTCLRQAAILSNPTTRFAMEVRDGCNGINVVVLLWSAILAYPASFKWKTIRKGSSLNGNLHPGLGLIINTGPGERDVTGLRRRRDGHIELE